MDATQNPVRTDFDFGWKRWESIPDWAKLTLEHQKGDILDVGCATCELCRYLQSRRWQGKYYGLDLEKYEGYTYPESANLIIGDAMVTEFPRADTVVMCNILEHVDNPIVLLSKGIRASKHNVIVNVPKRNEDMWKQGVVEYHQLDKTHKHCGYIERELYELVELSGGRIVSFKEMGATDPQPHLRRWHSSLPRRIICFSSILLRYLLGRIFSSETYYQEMWCEIVPRERSG